MSKYYVEEFSFFELGYRFLEFEGEKRIKSPKYGFEVNFKNYYDFNKGEIEYNIKIPYSFIREKLLLEKYEDIDFEDGDFFFLLSDVRGDIEIEILDYLKENNLVLERNL